MGIILIANAAPTTTAPGSAAAELAGAQLGNMAHLPGDAVMAPEPVAVYIDAAADTGSEIDPDHRFTSYCRHLIYLQPQKPIGYSWQELPQRP